MPVEWVMTHAAQTEDAQHADGASTGLKNRRGRIHEMMKAGQEMLRADHLRRHTFGQDQGEGVGAHAPLIPVGAGSQPQAGGLLPCGRRPG